MEVMPLVDVLLITLFLLELLTPYFVSHGMIPDIMGEVSQVLFAALVAFAYTRMAILRQIPGAAWFLLGVSAIGVTTALASGQGLTATLWGWWLLFKFPLVGIYAYLRPYWSEEFPWWLTKLCLAIMTIEVVFQLGQYLSGEPPGDHLAGTFGRHGAAHLFFLAFFTLCLALGQLVAHGRWKPFLLALCLGAASSVLAENKIFSFAILLLMLLAISLTLAHSRRSARTVLPLLLLTIGGVWGFTIAYNAFVAGDIRRQYQDYFLDVEVTQDYVYKLWNPVQGTSGRWSLGRAGGVQYSLRTMSSDPVTLLFGYGLGSRGQSDFLGTEGAKLRSDRYERGTQLMIMIQELGLFGLVVILGFTVWVVLALWRDVRREPHSPFTALRYALFLFSLLWLLWLWYGRPLESHATMLLYWASLGCVFGQSHRRFADTRF
jgi:hypothetical protein